MNIFEEKKSFQEKFYAQLSNLFLLMFMKDNERSRTKTYYISLVTIYFMQICGFMCTLSLKAVKD